MIKAGDRVRILDEGFDTMSDAKEAVRLCRKEYLVVENNIAGFVSIEGTPYLFAEEYLIKIH